MDKATLLKDRPIADVYGHTVSMPIVSIPCSLLDTDVAVPMAISNTLPQDILLGKNFPLLYQLIDPSSYCGVSRLSRTDSQTCSSLDD